MKKKIFLIVSIIILVFFISLNTQAQDVNLDSLVATNNYNSNATKLIITSDKNLNKINMLNMPNLVQVNISNVNIPDSSVINFKNRIKLLYLKNVIINMDGINDSNIEQFEIRHTYIYGNSNKTKNYEKIAKYNPKYIEDSSSNTTINNIAKSIYKNGMSKEEIIRDVTLYVTNHLTYNLSVVNNGKSTAQNALSGQGVCTEYAYLESQLLNKLGIYTLTIYGYPVNNSTYHAWNLVYLNNNWYTLDPTWLDTNGNNNTYNPASERYKNYYLRPINANIYNFDFTFYNAIPTSERKVQSIISNSNNTNTNNTQYTSSSSNTNTSTNNTQTNIKPSSNKSTNNNQNTTKPNTNNTQPSSSDSNTSINDSQKVTKPKINTNTTNTENIYTVEQEENTNNDLKNNDNFIKEETINNQTTSKDENLYVDIPNTSNNNTLFIIIGNFILLFGIHFIKTKKRKLES